MNYVRTKAAEYPEERDENYPTAVSPRMFLLGRASSATRLDSRLKHLGMTVLEKKLFSRSQPREN